LAGGGLDEQASSAMLMAVPKIKTLVYSDGHLGKKCMSEVFGKKPIRSSEFPLILFDAGGTLLHYVPSLEKFYENQFVQSGLNFSGAQIESAMMKSSRTFIHRAETDPTFELMPPLWLRAVLENLRVPEPERLEKEFEIVFKAAVKPAFLQTCVEVCTELKARNYRLAIAANWDASLSETLRLQGVMDLFESILTSEDLSFAKPRVEFFKAAAGDLDVDPRQVIYVGNSYAADVVGARRAGMFPILYDPTHRELKALQTEGEVVAQKIVSIDTLRNHRRLDNVILISKFQELLDFCLE